MASHRQLRDMHEQLAGLADLVCVAPRYPDIATSMVNVIDRPEHGTVASANVTRLMWLLQVESDGGKIAKQPDRMCIRCTGIP